MTELQFTETFMTKARSLLPSFDLSKDEEAIWKRKLSSIPIERITYALEDFYTNSKTHKLVLKVLLEYISRSPSPSEAERGDVDDKFRRVVVQCVAHSLPYKVGQCIPFYIPTDITIENGEQASAATMNSTYGGVWLGATNKSRDTTSQERLETMMFIKNNKINLHQRLPYDLMLCGNND